MCRLYGHIAPEPAAAVDLLADSRKSLLAQSKVKGREQKDGWGIGYFPGAVVEKSPKPIYREGARFRKAAQTPAPVVIAHIRAASNPRKLPKAKLIGTANTQPFAADGLVFAHNGTVMVPDAVVKRLGELRRQVRGLNDSEAYFLQFLKFYRRRGEVGAALEDCMRELAKLSKQPHHGLNTLISDGERLYAFCHYPGKYRAQLSRRPWGKMVWGKRGKRVVVASEPLDGGRWKDLRDGELLAADAGGRVTRRRLKLAC